MSQIANGKVMQSIMHHTIGEDYAACTGCFACSASCPRNCISMEVDWEGFCQPVIDSNCCEDCGVCRDICPVSKPETSVRSSVENGTQSFTTVWAAWSLDQEIRRQSSSGGVFSVLAHEILKKGGVVVGAAFTDNFVLRHVIINKQNDLYRLRGAKYVQSRLSSDLYQKIQEILRDGRLVLFSGTPCQVAGLRSVVKNKYNNLFCCDILCHGVPSPLLLKKYLDENFGSKQPENISFRDKMTGWKHYSIKLDFSNGQNHSTHFFNDPYMKAFLSDIALRNSCYTCQYATTNRQGDVTLADFWGVARKYHEYDVDDKGTSLVLVNNPKGQYWLDKCRAKLFLGHADINTAIAGNPVLIRPACRPPARNSFFHDIDMLSFAVMKKKYSLGPPSIYRRVINIIKRRLIRLTS